jgi:ABC-type anion transport system duplicated permease subunit
MKIDQASGWNIMKKLVVAGAVVALVAGMASTVPSAYAGGTIKVDDD